MRRVLTAVAILFLFAATCLADDAPAPLPTGRRVDLRLNVNANGRTVAQETRVYLLTAGINRISWGELPGDVDLSSARLTQIAGPGTVMMRSYQQISPKPINRQDLLNRFVGKQVTIYRVLDNGKRQEWLRGELLSADNGRVAAFRTGEGDILINPPGDVILPPQATVVAEPKPVVVWEVAASAAGDYTLELTYVTKGFTWNPTYLVTLSPNHRFADFEGWLNLANNTQTDVDGALWRLQADESLTLDGFQPLTETNTVDYPFATEATPISLAQGDSLRTALLQSRQVAASTDYVFDPLSTGPGAATPPQQLNRVLSIPNDQSNNLGIRLPAGRVLVYERATDRASNLIADTKVTPTPVGDTMDVSLGTAPGLEGQRKQTAFREVADRVQEQDIEITLKNNTAENVNVTAIEHPWPGWEILNSSLSYATMADGTVDFKPALASNSTVTITFTIRMKY